MEKTRNILVYIYACLYSIIFLYVEKHGVTTKNKVTLVCHKGTWKKAGISSFIVHLDT